MAALFAAALFVASGATRAFAQDLPEPLGRVSDFADVIPADTEAGLEDALRLAEEETTVEIAIVIVRDLGGRDINDYAVRLFEKWGIGQRGEDNGLLFITAIAEREVWIEVGYGLEPYITDGRAGRILDEEVLPGFSEDNFALGIVNGAYALRLALDETGYKPGLPRPAPSAGSRFAELVDKWAWLVVVTGILSVYAFTFMARTKSVWFGGAWGAGVGGLAGWLLGGWPFMLAGIGIAGVSGLFLDALLSNGYRQQKSSGKSTGWLGSGGGFRGSTGGFGRSGGGGFGGGRSGGGGAGRKF